MSFVYLVPKVIVPAKMVSISFIAIGVNGHNAPLLIIYFFILKIFKFNRPFAY